MASIGPVSAVSRFHNSACRAAASSGTISPASQSALSRRPFETGVSSLSMQSIAVVLVVVLTGASLPSLWMNYLHNRVHARSISLDDRQATVQAVAGDLPLPSGGELFPKGWEDQAAGKLLDYATSAGDEYKPSPGCQSLVPRIFYQSGKEAESDLDAHRKEWRNSWKKQLQSWQFLYWEDSGNREFIETYYPWFLERYDGFARGVMRADALRVFFLYHHGGVYADLDFQCLRDISPLLCDSDVVLGRLPHAHAPWSEHMIPNAIMASAPRQQLWVVAMYLLMTFSTDHVESATGPVMINTAIQQYSDVMLDFKASKFFEEIGPKLGDELQPVEEPTRLVVMPGEFLYPVDWTGGDMQDLTFARIGSNETAKNKLVFESNHTAMFPNSYAVTWWTHSWGR